MFATWQGRITLSHRLWRWSLFSPHCPASWHDFSQNANRGTGWMEAEAEFLWLQRQSCNKNHGECDKVCRFRSSHPGDRSSSVLLPARSWPTLRESTGSPLVPASPGLISAPRTPRQCLRSRWPCRTYGRTGSPWFQTDQSCPGSPPPVMRQPLDGKKVYWDEACYHIPIMHCETAGSELNLWIPNTATIRSSHYQLSKKIILRIKTVT